MMTKTRLIFAILLIAVLPSYGQHDELKQAITFYAPFNDNTQAQIATGDANIYSAPERKEAPNAKSALPAHVAIASGEGLSGDALEFKEKVKEVVFFKAKGNMAYNNQDWTGTVSFWLKLTPEEDLEPGFCDPIQITDVGYNDASIWVDFTENNPRNFRLGVIGDLQSWNPDNIGPNDNPEFDKRLVTVENHPFSRDEWTHVLITYNSLGSGEGSASLYLNGELQGSKDRVIDPFNWELDKANIYLGLNYIGLMDELAIFNRSLSVEEVQTVYGLKKGLEEIL
ncbi:MAG: LamG domain-containing protein [Bacteroidota bacterium]